MDFYDKMVIPVTEVTELISECTKLLNMLSKMLKNNLVPVSNETVPAKDPIAEPSADPKQEASSDEEILPGVVLHKGNKKPFEMIIE